MQKKLKLIYKGLIVRDFTQDNQFRALVPVGWYRERSFHENMTNSDPSIQLTADWLERRSYVYLIQKNQSGQVSQL